MNSYDIGGYNPWLLRENIGIFKALLISVRDIIFSPAKFFGSISEKHPIGDALTFYVIFSLFGAAFGFASMCFLHGRLMVAGFLWFAVLIPIAIGISIIGLFLASFVVHCIAFLLRAKGGFSGTLSVVVYAYASSILFFPLGPLAVVMNIMPANLLLRGALLTAWIICAIAAGCWVVAIYVIGYMKVHRFGAIRAVSLLISPLVVQALIIILLIMAMRGSNAAGMVNTFLKDTKQVRAKPSVRQAHAGAAARITGGRSAANNIKKALKKTISADLRFGGTVRGVKNIKAIINDQVVSEGDEIEGYRVTKIFANKVSLKDKNGISITLE